MDLGAAIRSQPAFAHTRLILTTSFSARTSANELAAGGFNGFISKPVKRAQLLDALTRSTEATVTSAGGGSTVPSTEAVHAIHKAARPTFIGHVLVVDDNVVNQKVAQRFLQRLGCTVTIASSGSEAVDLATQNAFDLILMDLQMPGMDGCEATRRIRERTAPPIVALSADVSGSQIEAARVAGMVDYLTKPIEQERLQSVLAKFLPRAAAAAAG